MGQPPAGCYRLGGGKGCVDRDNIILSRHTSGFGIILWHQEEHRSIIPCSPGCHQRVVSVRRRIEIVLRTLALL